MPAFAQDGASTRYRVTAGAQVKPQHPGADSVDVLPYFDLDREKGSTQFRFEAPDDSFGFNLVSGTFEFGPAVSMVSPRKASNVGVPVPKVKRTFEVGAYANAWVGDGFRLHSEVRKAVNGHDGWVADGGADLILRDGDKWLFSFGPRVTWADGKYHDAYYGVTPATALATALPVYDPGSGIESYGAAASAEFALSPRWGVALYGKYDRLTGDAARSPIVQAYGSRDQFSAGVGLSYTFGG
ncbi:MipA/OmpV family protein [Tsuneonella sp. HG222]